MQPRAEAQAVCLGFALSLPFGYHAFLFLLVQHLLFCITTAYAKGNFEAEGTSVSWPTRGHISVNPSKDEDL